MKQVLMVAVAFLLPACVDDDATAPTPIPTADVASDVTPPTLTALSLSSTSITTSDASATVTIGFAVTDDVSGVSQIGVRFFGPSGAIVFGSSSFSPTLSHTGSLEATFPQHSASGTWTMDVYLQDAVGNYRQLSTDDLTTLGLPATVAVFSAVQDATPPVLTALEVAPNTINTTAGSATVTISVAVTDDVSGVNQIGIRFFGPSGAIVFGSSSFSPTLSHTGSLEATFPQHSASGTWTMDVYLQDAVGNYRQLSTDDLATLGLPTTVAVANNLHVIIDIQPGSSQNAI